MSEKSNQQQLRALVVEASEADNWEEARREWILSTIYDQQAHCVCNHPIVENCVITNERNQNTLIVGNVCVNHFDVDRLRVSGNARTCLQRLIESPDSSANEELLDIAERLNIINAEERRIYTELTTGPGSRSRFNPGHEKYSPKAVALRSKINSFLTTTFQPSRPRCATCQSYKRFKQNSVTKENFWTCPNMVLQGKKYVHS